MSVFKNDKSILSFLNSFLSYSVRPPIGLIYCLAFINLQIAKTFSSDLNGLKLTNT